MSAKSPAQLFPLAQSPSAAVHLRGTLVILALALLMAGAAWLLERNESLVRDQNIVREAVAVAKIEPRAVAQPVVAPSPELVDEPALAEVPTSVASSRYRTLSEFLAKRYKVSQAVTLDLVTMAHAAGHQIGLDPLLIIAVMAVESRFNPIAESVAGAKGLMQIIPRYHTEKFSEVGGVKQVFDPETNIYVGSQIIKEYIARTGDLNSALQLYGGATRDENDVYFGKVMTEKERLQQVLRKSPSRPGA